MFDFLPERIRPSWSDRPFETFLMLGLSLWLVGQVLGGLNRVAAMVQYQEPEFVGGVMDALDTATDGHEGTIISIVNGQFPSQCDQQMELDDEGNLKPVAGDQFASEGCVEALNGTAQPAMLKTAIQGLQGLGLTVNGYRSAMSGFVEAPPEPWGALAGGTGVGDLATGSGVKARFPSADSLQAALLGAARSGSGQDLKLTIGDLGQLASASVKIRSAQNEASVAAQEAGRAIVMKRFKKIATSSDILWLLLLFLGLSVFRAQRSMTNGWPRHVWTVGIFFLVVAYFGHSNSALNDQLRGVLGHQGAESSAAAMGAGEALLVIPLGLLDRLWAFAADLVWSAVGTANFATYINTLLVFLLLEASGAAAIAMVVYLFLVIGSGTFSGGTFTDVVFFPFDTDTMSASIGMTLVTWSASFIGCAAAVLFLKGFWEVVFSKIETVLTQAPLLAWSGGSGGAAQAMGSSQGLAPAAVSASVAVSPSPPRVAPTPSPAAPAPSRAPVLTDDAGATAVVLEPVVPPRSEPATPGGPIDIASLLVPVDPSSQGDP